jgi:hypothetical protein
VGERKGANFHDEIFSWLEEEVQGIWIRIMGKGRLGKNNLQTWEEIELRYETTIRY